jgi:hypothetical protein
MYFGNIRRIGCPWRVANCVTMRLPSDTFPVSDPVGRQCGISL